MARRKRFKIDAGWSRTEIIEKVFQMVCKGFDDEKSTEFLIAITADICDVDYEDVIDALVEIDERNLR